MPVYEVYNIQVFAFKIAHDDGVIYISIYGFNGLRKALCQNSSMWYGILYRYVDEKVHH